nr:MAG TPA: hypothetical protein [Caudoviricetes sp.]
MNFITRFLFRLSKNVFVESFQQYKCMKYF